MISAKRARKKQERLQKRNEKRVVKGKLKSISECIKANVENNATNRSVIRFWRNGSALKHINYIKSKLERKGYNVSIRQTQQEDFLSNTVLVVEW